MAEKKKKSVWRWVFLGSGLLVAVWLLFNARANVLEKARKTEGLVMASGLTSAVENFHGEYERLLDVGVDQFQTDGPAGKMFLEVLSGLEGSQLEPQNTRSIIFLQVREAKGRKGGIVYGPKDTVEAVYDPFGNPYTVVLNSKNGDTLVFQFGDQTVRLRGKQVAVYSSGRDGKLNTPDDIKSWN